MARTGTRNSWWLKIGAAALVELLSFAPLRVAADVQPLPPPLFTTIETQAIPIPSAFGERVLIEGTINGRTFWFHLDTGTTGLALTREAARATGLLEDVDAHVLTVDLDVGALHAKSARFSILDGYSVDDAAHHVDGLIGAPFFRSNIVTIDFPARSVTVYPRGYPPPAAGVATPLLIRGYSAAVQVTWGSTPSTLYLDTGADRTILFSSFTRTIVHGPSIATYTVNLGFGAPTTDVEEVYTPPMHLAALTVRHPAVLLTQSPPAWLQQYDGILGRDALRLFSVTLDYAGGMAYWR
jgi:hypothetical protein